MRGIGARDERRGEERKRRMMVGSLGGLGDGIWGSLMDKGAGRGEVRGTQGLLEGMIRDLIGDKHSGDVNICDDGLKLVGFFFSFFLVVCQIESRERDFFRFGMILLVDWMEG